MKIRVRGEMTIAAMRQAVHETLANIEDEFAVRFTRGATLYINPTDGAGGDVVPKNRRGREVSTVQVDGPYRSAADEHEA